MATPMRARSLASSSEYETLFGRGAAFSQAGYEILSVQASGTAALPPPAIASQGEPLRRVAQPARSCSTIRKRRSKRRSIRRQFPPPDAMAEGPCIIEFPGQSVVVPPGATARADRYGNLHVRRVYVMSTMNPIVFEVIRNRLIAITEEMRVALQSVSGSPTVTEASDFFTGLFTPDGAVASMGFQVAYHAPVSGAFIRHIRNKEGMTVADGDMFIGNDPYIAALHQNDVQMVAPIFAGDTIIAWAGVEAHETDVGGMDFASWSPKAKEIWQEGMRIPCVKLIDRGEMRDDVLEMIVTASRLPALLGLDIRAFIATLNVARDRVSELARRYGADVGDRGDGARDRRVGSAHARAAARTARRRIPRRRFPRARRPHQRALHARLPHHQARRRR